MSRRTMLVAFVVAVITATGTALAARAPVTSKQLASISIDQAAPTTTAGTFTPTSLALANRATPTAGTAGFAESGDTVTITFSHAIKQSTVCSNWTANETSRTLTLSAVLSDNTASNGNDRLVLNPPGGTCTGSGGFRFGQVDLGSASFVSTKNVPFASSTMTVSGSTITITLGTPGSPPSDGTRNTVSSATTAVYTPEAGIKNTSDVSVSGTASVTAVQW